MSFKIDQRECRVCQRKVLGLRRRPNHVLHLLLSLGTGGLWLLGWMVITLNSEDEPWRCTSCESPTDEVEHSVAAHSDRSPFDGPGAAVGES